MAFVICSRLRSSARASSGFRIWWRYPTIHSSWPNASIAACRARWISRSRSRSSLPVSREAIAQTSRQRCGVEPLDYPVPKARTTNWRDTAGLSSPFFCWRILNPSEPASRGLDLGEGGTRALFALPAPGAGALPRREDPQSCMTDTKVRRVGLERDCRGRGSHARHAGRSVGARCPASDLTRARLPVRRAPPDHRDTRAGGIALTGPILNREVRDRLKRLHLALRSAVY